MKRLLILPLLMALSSYGQDTSRMNLSDVSITASRFRLEAVSAKVIVMDSTKNYAQETPSFFGQTPSVAWQSDNGTPFGYSYFTLRGMPQNRINYTMNGVPLNDGEDLSVYTSNYTDVLNNLKSIQIVRGSGVSSNGASSYAGLVNMELASPFDNHGSEVTTSYGSFNSYHESISFCSDTMHGFGIAGRISATGSDGWKQYSQGKSTSIYLTGGYRNKYLSVRFNYMRGFTENGQAWLPTPQNAPKDSNVLVGVNRGPQEDHFIQNIYQIQLSSALSNKITFNFSPYIVTLDGHYNFPSYDMYGNMIDTSKLDYLKLNSINGGLYTNFKYAYRDLIVEIGVTGNSFTRTHNDDSLNGDYNYSNHGNKKDFSEYIKASYRINKLTFNLDLQKRDATLVYYEQSIKPYTVYDYSFGNFNLGTSYKLNKYFSPYISFAKTSREPTRTDFFGGMDWVNSSNIDSINTVKPETVYDIELGTKLKWKGLSGSLNGYSMWFNDAIMSTNHYNRTGILIMANVKDSRKMGVEGDLKWWLCRYFNATTSFNFSHNEVINNGETKQPLLTPDAIINLGGEFVFSKKLKLGLSYKYVASQFLEATNQSQFTVPSYNTVDAQLHWNAFKWLTASFFVNNLANKNYKTSGNCTYDINNNPVSNNYFYSAGTNYYLSITLHNFSIFP